MPSAENKCGRALVDAPAVHWKPLTASSRGSIFNRRESLNAALRKQPTMKPTLLNSKITPLPSHTASEGESLPAATTPPAASAPLPHPSLAVLPTPAPAPALPPSCRATSQRNSASHNATFEPRRKSWRAAFPIPTLSRWLRSLGHILHNAAGFLQGPLQAPSLSPEQIARVDARFAALWLQADITAPLPH